MERRTPWLGYLCVILSAVIFGCMPLGANFLYAQGVTPMSLVFLRNLLSLPVLALLCQKQGGLRISRGALLETSLTGFFGCCITPILLFSSYCYLASGMATVFHFAYPVIVVLGGLVLRERVQKKVLFCAVLCSLGILLLIDPSGAVDPLGVALALTSGVTYAVYILLLAHFHHREVMGFRMTFYMALISAVCMFFLCLFSHQLCLPQALAGWLAALAFSLMICIGAVMAAETTNTAIEAVVDLVSPEYHLLAKHAKDCAAGAALILAATSIVVAAIVFIPKIGELLC